MRLTPLLLLLVALPLRADDLGLKVPPNFRVTLWADHTLANDIYTMCLDEKGRVVVSGPGYIRRLEDTKGLGKAEKATDIAETTTGAMGLLFAENSRTRDTGLFVSADNHAIEFWPNESTGVLRPRPLDLFKTWPSSEHGGHAIKMGPDGFLYAIAGNDGRLGSLPVDKSSPIRSPEAGGILRFPVSATSGLEVIACGFRNPYDFDFTPLGDIITFDSDTERDYGLPWYSPTRVYHVMPGAHHGWRLTGGSRSLARRDYYPDTVPIIADMGRGSPTGVCCYRHTQFPEHYRGGVFLLDWTFGRVYYMPLIPEGSSYRAVKPELFLEATGGNGFAPTGIRVAPDGSLFICIGGRGTRGAVYRIEYLVDGKHPVIPKAEPEKDIDRVLDAPQPLEAWSIAKWMPIADTLKFEAFTPVVLEETESDIRRVRALDILDAKNARISTHFANVFIEAMLKCKSEIVRSRVARCLQNDHGRTGIAALWTFARDESPRVRTEALMSIAILSASGRKQPTDFETLSECMGHPDRRVRLAACRVASILPENQFLLLDRGVQLQRSSGAIVSLLIARSWRNEHLSMGGLFNDAATAFELAKTPSERLNAIRGMMISLGDWNINGSPLELHAAYSTPGSKPEDAAYIRLLSHGAINTVLSKLPSTNPHENVEAARLLAMFQPRGYDPIAFVFNRISADSHPSDDFHYLTVLSRLPTAWHDTHTKEAADALLALDKKFAERSLRVEGNYPPRLRELVGELTRQHPALEKVLAAHADLVTPGNVLIAAKLNGDSRKEAAKRFLTVARDNAEFSLTRELIDLLATLPAEEVRPVFRAHWSDRPARELLVKQLAAKPEEIDRGKFLDVLEIASGETASISLKALETLPRDDSPKDLVPLFARLRQALSDPKEAGTRKSLLNLIKRQAGQAFSIEESKTDSASLSTAYRLVFEWFEKTHPAEAKRLTTSGEEEAVIRQMMPSVKWEAGDVERGQKLFRDRGCQACHGGTTRLGPDLAAVGKRFSRDDLLTAIVNPSRDVAPAYRVTNLYTKDGKRISGIIVYDSNEALLVQTGTGETKRVAYVDIESRSPSPKSLMPDGLLKGMKPEELADLFAFLGKQ